MVAQAGGLEDDRARLGAEDRETPVHDDAFVRRNLNHGARLNDEFIRHADGVRARERLRARPGGLGPTFSQLRRRLNLLKYRDGGGWGKVKHHG